MNVSAKRVGGVAAAGLLILLIIFGSWLYRMLTLKPGPRSDFTAAYRDLQLSNRPTPDTPDAWPDLLALWVLLREAEYTVAGSPEPVPDFRRAFDLAIDPEERQSIRSQETPVDFTRLCDRYWSPTLQLLEDDEEQLEEEAMRRRMAEEVLTRLEPQLEPHLQALAAARWATLYHQRGEESLHSLMMGRELACMLAARTERDWADGDTESLVLGLEAYFGLVRTFDREPSQIYRITAASLRQMIAQNLRHIATRSPPRGEDAARIEAVLSAATEVPPLSLSLKSGRLRAIQAMESLYSGRDGGDGRFLPVHAERAMTFPQDVSGTLSWTERMDNLGGSTAPSRKELRRLIDTLWDEVEALGEHADAAGIARLNQASLARLDAVAPRHDEHEWGSGFITFGFPEMVTVVGIDRLEKQEIRYVILMVGLRAMLALEQVRAATGHYPDALDELDLDWLHEPLPGLDQVLHYRRIDPAEDELGRGYLLYLPGPDNTDDGGTAGVRGDPLESEGGTDYVINRLED